MSILMAVLLMIVLEILISKPIKNFKFLIVCEFCKSKNIVRAGFRYNTSGKKQRHKCNKCDGLFVVDDGFKKMKHKPEIIAEACSCYKRGMSLKDAKEHLIEYRDTNVSRKTILMWIRKYSRILKKFADKQTKI